MRRIRRIVDEMVEGQLSQEDLKALHFSQFRFALEEDSRRIMLAWWRSSAKLSNDCSKRGW